jgi:menaquinone-dependent protoporphyrinogen oxidase
MDAARTVLVAYASESGSTKEIAEFIAAHRNRCGLRAEARSIAEVPDPAGFDAVVLGCAVHDRAWLPIAEEYVRRFQHTLAQQRVWMFSVGMAAALRGVIGQRLAAATPSRIAALRTAVKPRAYQQFAGVWPRQNTTVTSRLIYRVIGGRRYGDLRDWPVIARWADSIATELLAATAHQRN